MAGQLSPGWIPLSNLAAEPPRRTPAARAGSGHRHPDPGSLHGVITGDLDVALAEAITAAAAPARPGPGPPPRARGSLHGVIPGALEGALGEATTAPAPPPRPGPADRPGPPDR